MNQPIESAQEGEPSVAHQIEATVRRTERTETEKYLLVDEKIKSRVG